MYPKFSKKYVIIIFRMIYKRDGESLAWGDISSIIIDYRFCLH